MRRSIKQIGHLFFFLLTMAVALRPVMVDASKTCAFLPTSRSIENLCLSTSVFSHPVDSPLALRTSFHLSNLSIIPKENPCVGNGLSPAVKVAFCEDLGRHSTLVSPLPANSSGHFLVLRI